MDELTWNTIDDLRRAKDGDAEALGRLLESRRGVLRRLAEGQLGGRLAARVDASDVVQMTFFEAYRSIQQFRGGDEAEFAAWLRTILNHNIATQIRDHTRLEKRNLRRERSIHAPDDGGDAAPRDFDAGVTSPSLKFAKGEEQMRLFRALDELPPDQKLAVRLRHLENRPLTEIAERLDRSPAAAAGLIKRGLQALRKRMNPSDTGESPASEE